MRAIVKNVSLIASLMLTAPAFAQDARPILWGDLRVGMSKDEVKALLPKSRVVLSDKCNVNAYPRFDRDGLKRIDMEAVPGYDKWEAQCGLVVEAALTTKYGTAKVGDGSNDCSFSFTSSAGNALMCSMASKPRFPEPPRYSYKEWVADGAQITFRLDQSRTQEWRAVYGPAPAVDAAVGAKL